jgi:hypothetical protein
MPDKTELLERKVHALTMALFELANYLRSATGSEDGFQIIQTAGNDLWIDLVALNDGKGPDGRIGGH